MSIDDERVRFYLRHRAQLEEWQALRTEAATAIDEWLSALKPDVEAAVEALGGDLQLVSLVDDGSYPSVDLRRPWWQGAEKAEADVQVGLQWARRKSLLGPDSAPYVGVRSNRDTAIGTALREDQEFQRIRRDRKDKNTQWWPAFSYVLPVAPFPEQAEEYRRSLVEWLLAAWSIYSPVIDRVVNATAARDTR